MTLDQGHGTARVENNNDWQNHFLQANTIIPVAKGIKWIIKTNNQISLALLVLNN